MEKKKTKLKLSGNLNRSITNIEKAKTQGKNSVLIEKKKNKFSNKRTFNTSSKLSTNFKPSSSSKLKSPGFTKPKPILLANDYEKRKLAEQMVSNV